MKKNNLILLPILLLLLSGCGSKSNKTSEFNAPFQESNQVSVKTNSIVVNETLNEKQNINDDITNSEKIELKTYENEFFLFQYPSNLKLDFVEIQKQKFQESGIEYVKNKTDFKISEKGFFFDDYNNNQWYVSFNDIPKLEEIKSIIDTFNFYKQSLSDLIEIKGNKGKWISNFVVSPKSAEMIKKKSEEGVYLIGIDDNGKQGFEIKGLQKDSQYHFVTNMYDLLEILQFPIIKVTSDKSNNLKNSDDNNVVSELNISEKSNLSEFPKENTDKKFNYGKKSGMIDIGNNYYKKNKSIYFCDEEECKVIEEINSNFFEVLYSSITDYIKDDKNVFMVYHGYSIIITKIEGADVNTFKILKQIPLMMMKELLITQDKNNVYINGQKNTLNIDSKTFKVLERSFAKDKNNVYGINDAKFDKIDFLDPNTLVVFKGEDRGYLKDKSGVYYDFDYSITPVLNADSETFEIIDIDRSVAKDKNHVYDSEQTLANIDPATVQIIENNSKLYLKDSNGVYCNGTEKIKDADPKYFQILQCKLDNCIYAIDKNNAYSNFPFGVYKDCMEKLEGIDPKTLIVYDTQYMKDKNYVYFKGKILEGADPKTFDINKKQSPNNTN